ncbi:general substrate transporter [Aspergillus welwitschiae]|uniref:General substrate transporter n=1 Tax=Aspergillus welwitschiae TaxID=1341132 RepID=A0A3F3PHB0_9EURO|nr:general substrate transporter [Aspergillus welwitschiae]RDH26321.1 general substrate transporter [Aspergillus welwitschiae]
MNSIPWIGKLVGCFLAEPLIERTGYRKAIIVTSVVQVIALIIEMNREELAEVENLVPAYCAEIAPSAVRGLLAGSVTFVVALGNPRGSGVSGAYVDQMSARGWLIPCAMQLIPAVNILSLVAFIPESPRWLLLKDKRDLALRNLEKLRSNDEVDNGYVAAEVEAIAEAIQAGYAQDNDSDSWWKVFSDPTNHGRRAWIVALLFIFQQTNGNQFVNSYGPTFYRQSGYGSAYFTYATVGQAMTIVGSLIGILVTAYTGRRPLMIGGGLMCGVQLSIGAALGSQDPPNQAEKRTVIATFPLLGISTKISASNNAFLIGAEIGGVKMRKKIMGFGTGNDVLAAFLVTFATPYLLASPSPDLGPQVGWISAAAGYLSGLYGFFFTTELKGRSLEEVDQMFEARLHAWEFKDFQTTGAGRRLVELERHDKTALEEGMFTAYICHAMSVNIKAFPPIFGRVIAPKHDGCRILHNR